MDAPRRTPSVSGHNIRVLKNRHQGATIYVIASGASLDYVDPQFFDDKISITVNEAYQRFGLNLRGPSYVLMHHHDAAQAAIDAGCRLVTSQHDCGFATWPHADFQGEYYTYRTAENTLSLTPTINLGALERDADDELVISPSTVAEAVHFAAHLGATTIILCGADGGTLDGRLNVQHYNDGAGTNPQHVRLTEPLLLEVVTRLRARGVAVMSLNPFINFWLEGHVYERPPYLSGRALVTALNATGGIPPRRPTAPYDNEVHEEDGAP